MSVETRKEINDLLDDLLKPSIDYLWLDFKDITILELKGKVGKDNMVIHVSFSKWSASTDYPEKRAFCVCCLVYKNGAEIFSQDWGEIEETHNMLGIVKHIITCTIGENCFDFYKPNGV